MKLLKTLTLIMAFGIPSCIFSVDIENKHEDYIKHFFEWYSEQVPQEDVISLCEELSTYAARRLCELENGKVIFPDNFIPLNILKLTEKEELVRKYIYSPTEFYYARAVQEGVIKIIFYKGKKVHESRATGSPLYLVPIKNIFSRQIEEECNFHRALLSLLIPKKKILKARQEYEYSQWSQEVKNIPSTVVN